MEEANHIAYILNYLKDRRVVDVDYELNMMITKDTVEEVLDKADDAYRILLNLSQQIL
ncbi:MAG: hypothetical protein QXE95_04225 [Candidatus Nitrosocaldus sp.]